MINCSKCHAWYVKDYVSCPKCNGKCIIEAKFYPYAMTIEQAMVAK